MVKNTGKPYEVFVSDIYKLLTKDDRYTTVQHDVKIEGQDGPRQIDVLLRSKIANIELLTVIECRDYCSRLDITHIDAFHSKLIDVKASKGVLVSAKGFSKKATSKAARLGITLCLASDARNVLEEVGIKIPVRVHEIYSTYDATFKIHIEYPGQAIRHGEVQTVNGVNLLDALHDELLTGKLIVPSRNTEVKWFPSNISPPYTIRDKFDQTVSITELSLTAKLGVRYYFGHINSIPGISAIHEMDTNSTTLLFRESDAPKIIPSLTEYRSPEEIPPIYKLTINLIRVNRSD
jgi:hypothetical protein